MRKATLLSLPKDGGADAAFDKLEGNVPQGDARYRRELVPREALLPDRRLAFGRKGPNAARQFAYPGLVDEDDGSALSRAVFLVSADASSSNARSRLRLPPATARPLAGKVQFLDEPPHTRFRIPLGADLRDELGPRASVHRSVAYPCAKAPASSASTNRFFSASVSRGGR